MATGQGYYGSFCLETVFAGKLQKGTNGKTYVCIDDLKQSPFNEGKTNGLTYVNIGVWVNEDIDDHGNIAGITLSQTKQEREEKVKKIYIGNLRRSGPAENKASSPATQQGTVVTGPQIPNDLPF